MRTQRLKIHGQHFGAVVCDGRQNDKGGTLVLLHGFTGSAAGWGELLTAFSTSGLRVIALDMLGHGLSDAPKEVERYSMEHCQADIIAVLQELGVSPGTAILLGYSMGGRIALYCAFSDFFRALVLESASAGLATAEEREQRQRSDAALAERIERIGIEAFVAYWEQIPLFASQKNLPAERRASLHAQRLNNRPQGLANSLRGIGTGVQPALHERLSELDLPVLLITGALDPKFYTIARLMAQRLPQAQLHIVAGTGHTVHLEQPGTFVQLVQDFCTTVL
ncbi:2-succinyl-6-hydroxy-2,4-cyclohexadiene-1-carboxylate synthase [Ktedonosporobacter rubrisoli]|uniref:Putative 2-succinyl-6-hydroxy-2,4-cyclohexadiene-1-carboxylate synthase n=1 Tax=Ktedonosporobacter rubrisoli TaxID=2509675 RepID=A0A4P6JTU2_KTERU|nr:2-succinyl-6-hydroxy-2,4-cyclohexadiene-1-carboxylate synthase [Ktedonosporobacter rubrisoli]QBD79008.1 2-succinyl-6-hydroxy-2,4-cyclohexadiene-1-carboxylate synthase [Ktedonosporobacter rubrisoli]